MKRLMLLRHGKSDWGDASLDDFDRQLAPRGIKASKKIARFLVDHKLVPDHALCSEAARARQTWELVQDNLDKSVDTTYRHDLYLAEPSALLGAAKDAPAACGSLILIAHNPGLGHLTGLLVADGDAEAINNLGDNFPTAGLAVLECDIKSWDELPRAQAYLSHFIRPRNL